jgi:hypothetical protein
MQQRMSTLKTFGQDHPEDAEEDCICTVKVNANAKTTQARGRKMETGVSRVATQLGLVVLADHMLMNQNVRCTANCTMIGSYSQDFVFVLLRCLAESHEAVGITRGFG